MFETRFLESLDSELFSNLLFLLLLTAPLFKISVEPSILPVLHIVSLIQCDLSSLNCGQVWSLPKQSTVKLDLIKTEVKNLDIRLERTSGCNSVHCFAASALSNRIGFFREMVLK